jgi:hypothetical protein
MALIKSTFHEDRWQTVEKSRSTSCCGVFALFLAGVFIHQGWANFDDTSGWARAFHFPVWFRSLIGVLERSEALLRGATSAGRISATSTA